MGKSQPIDDWEEVAPESAGSVSDWEDVDPATAGIPDAFHTNPAEAFGAGGAQGMSLGFFDELYGGAQHPIGGLKSLVGYEPEEDADVAAYRRERDTARDAFGATSVQNPKSFVAGDVAGSVASSLVPGAAMAKLPAAGARIAASAGLGGIEGFGRSESDTASGQLFDTAVGAAGGATGQAIGEGIGAVVDKFRPRANPGDLPAIPGQTASPANPAQGMIDRLDDFAEKRAVKQSGAMLGDFRALDNKGRLNETGRALLDNGVVTPLSSLEDISARAGKLVEEHGKKLVAVEDAIDSRFDQLLTSNLRDSLVSPERVAVRMDAFLNELRADPFLKDLVPPLESKVQNLMAMGKEPITFQQARRLKGSLDELIDWDKVGTPGKELLKRLRGIFNNEIEQGVNAIAQQSSHPQAFNQWRASKKLFGIMKDVKEIADDKLFREEANRFISPSDYITAVGGGIAGTAASDDPTTGALSAVALGALNHAGRKYGSSLAATGANKLARGLETGVPASITGVNRAVTGVNRSLLPGKAGSAAARGAFGRDPGEQGRDQVLAKVKGTQWEQVLNDAAQRGPESFASTYFLLNSSYPSFRAILSKDAPNP